MGKFTLTLVMLFLVTGADNAESNVFGKDHRQTPHSQAFPLNMIGRLISSTLSTPSQGCTGGLIGPDLVLTDLHCVSEVLANDNDGVITFKLGYDDGKELASSTVKSIFAPYTKSPQGITYIKSQDYAILTLTEPLGSKYGWFKVAPRSSDYKGAGVSMAGYSGDINDGESLSIHKNCHLYGFSQGYITHDCDLAPGSSGSPIFQVVRENEAVIVALNVGQFTGLQHLAEDQHLSVEKFSETFANYAILNEKFISEINGVLKSENILPYEGGAPSTIAFAVPSQIPVTSASQVAQWKTDPNQTVPAQDPPLTFKLHKIIDQTQNYLEEEWAVVTPKIDKFIQDHKNDYEKAKKALSN